MKKPVIALAVFFALGVVSALAILVLIPLLYPRALPKSTLASLLIAPSPPPPPPLSLKVQKAAHSPAIAYVYVSAAVMKLNLRQRTPALEPDDVTMTGEVALHAVINEQGNIESARIVSGHPMLQQAALESVKNWKYRPYCLNGKPVKVHTTIRVMVPSE